MTLETDILSIVANNPDAASLSGYPNGNQLATYIEHYKARKAIGSLGLALVPKLIGQSYAPTLRTSNNNASAPLDTDFVTLASIVVPGGTMGLSSKMVIVADWDCTSSASTKTFALDFGGANVSAPSATTSVAGKFLIEIQNLNSLSIQKTMNTVVYALTTNPRLSTTVNTAADVLIDFKCKWGASIASDSITLLGYSIWHYPGS